jgi:DNA polymerase V
MKTTQPKEVKKSKRGGKRPGAGRPKGTGKYGEPTRAVRVPERLVTDIKAWCKSLSSPNFLKGEVYEGSHETIVPLTLYSNKIPAGFPSPADDHAEEKLDLNQHLIKNPSSTFYVRVSGDSMIGAGIHPDDMLVVDRSIRPRHGKIIIAVLNGELTVKRMQQRRGKVILMPENENYQPIPIAEEMDFSIWGVVTNVIHSV